MSTKQTVFYDDDFHLYKETGDDYNLYLQINNDRLVEFKFDNKEVTIGIPADILKRLQDYQGSDLDWANKSDADILAFVEKSVDSRIEHHFSIDDHDLLSQLSGLLEFGDVTSSREEQIASGVDFYTHRRKIEQDILSKYNKHKSLL